MSRFIIKGGRRLAGTYRPVGNKNAVLPMLAASVLTDQPIVLRNVPRILDVQVMLELLARLGVAVEQKDSTVTLCAAGIKSTRLDRKLCSRVRSSILLAGPLAARLGKAQIYPPGGDVIGRRRLDTHFEGLRALGISVGGDRYYSFKRKSLIGCDLLLDEASVTGTENILMASVLAEGTTTIFNAACEPHVQDLGLLLNAMGARIDGLGTNCVVVRGVKELKGASFTVSPDHIEIGSFLAAAAATRGDLEVDGVFPQTNRPLGLPARYMDVIERSFRKLGVSWTIRDDCLSMAGSRQKLIVHRDAGGAIPKIEDGAWPAFPSDLMSVAIVLATQAVGAVLFFEKMFESRMYFVDRLLEMGARIIQCDPHRVVVTGLSRLHGSRMTTPDIRAGMSLLVAALCAKGESIIENAEIIDRGYERIDDRLRELGADIVREP